MSEEQNVLPARYVARAAPDDVLLEGEGTTVTYNEAGIFTVRATRVIRVELGVVDEIDDQELV